MVRKVGWTQLELWVERSDAEDFVEHIFGAVREWEQENNEDVIGFGSLNTHPDNER